jgi:hypothetical protein
MALLLHIISAFTSLVFTAYMFFRPSAAKLQVSVGLIAGTVGTGTLLVVSKPGHILETCIMGLFYLVVTVFGTVAAQRKLAAQNVRSDRR